MARSSECKEQYAQKTLDTADIVRLRPVKLLELIV
jgi:hypothetical protein